MNLAYQKTFSFRILTSRGRALLYSFFLYASSLFSTEAISATVDLSTLAEEHFRSLRVDVSEEQEIMKLVLLVVAGDRDQRSNWLLRLERASEYYQSATGHLILGMIFNDQVYTERDVDKSILHFKRSAALGVPLAQFNVGALMSEKGAKYEAMCWLMRAIYSGHNAISSFDEFSKEFSLDEVTIIERAVVEGSETCEMLATRMRK